MPEPAASAPISGLVEHIVDEGLLAAIGVDVGTLVWALLGGVLGESFSRKHTLPVALLRLLASSAIAALAATTLFTGSLASYRDLAAVALSWGFFGLTRRLAARLDDIVDRGLAQTGVPPPRDRDDGANDQKETP